MPRLSIVIFTTIHCFHFDLMCSQIENECTLCAFLASSAFIRDLRINYVSLVCVIVHHICISQTICFSLFIGYISPNLQ